MAIREVVPGVWGVPLGHVSAHMLDTGDDMEVGGGLNVNGEVVICRLNWLTRDHFAELLAEGETSGYRFLGRVIDEWESGVNRFGRHGEGLFAAEVDDRLVGICGLNVDPYLEDPRIARVRNVYVLARCRGQGIGRRLVEEAIATARGQFDRLRLRAEEERPAKLYESLGFRPCYGVPDCTHIMDLAEKCVP